MTARHHMLHELNLRGRRRAPTVRRIREVLRVTIVQGLLPGAMLPSEWELMSRFGVSRGVIREALELLRAEGLIDRLQGAGTFVVSRAREVIKVEQLGAMVRNIDDGDARVRWDLLAFEVTAAPALIAERLRLTVGEEVVYAERRQTLDGQPVMLRSSWMPRAIGVILLEEPAAHRRTLDDLVEQALGHSVRRADLRIEATLVDAATALALSISEGASLMLLERLVFDILGRPVEYGHARIRADRFALTTVMHRPAGPPMEGASVRRLVSEPHVIGC